MYTALRSFPRAPIHSTRLWAWPTVSSASTSTASRSPEISVADIGDQTRAFSPGARSLAVSGSDGATWTSHLSDVDRSVVGNVDRSVIGNPLGSAVVLRRVAYPDSADPDRAARTRQCMFVRYLSGGTQSAAQKRSRMCPTHTGSSTIQQWPRSSSLALVAPSSEATSSDIGSLPNGSGGGGGGAPGRG